jgi:hypothetical protein
LHVRANTDIDIFIKDMRWLGAHLDPSCLPLSEEDKKRWYYALLRIQQAIDIAFTFQGLHDSKIPKNKLYFLHKRLDILNEHGQSKAPDYFFELQTAGRLLRYLPPESIIFQEPDIIINPSDNRIGIACKYLQSEKNLSHRISDAADQGKRARVPFIIMIDISEIFRSKIGAKAIHVDTQEELTSQIDNFVSDFMGHHTNSIKRSFEKEACGVIILARSVGWVNKPSLALNWHTAFMQCPNISIPSAGFAIQQLIELMRK